MDQGIIRCFKAHYRKKYFQLAVGRYEASITPSEIYDINQLEAMQLADITWHEVDTTAIRNCWQKARILPNMDPSAPAQPTIPISSAAENALRDALDDLEATGALQSRNRMDIESLLNAPEESRMVEVTTDEEICRAVLAACNAQEGGGRQ